jgi:K+-sensing histidine kinase KdpD
LSLIGWISLAQPSYADRHDHADNRLASETVGLLRGEISSLRQGELFNVTRQTSTLLPNPETAWWFYLTVVLILVAYPIYWLRLRCLREKTKTMEKLVAARTMELSNLVEQLVRSESAHISSMESKDRIIALILHDLRSPICFLKTISQHLVQNAGLLDKAMLESKLQALHAGTFALAAYTEQFFAWATTQHKDFIITATSFKISDLFKETTLLYAEILKSRGNNISIHETNLICDTDYQILAVILRNLIDNANKNTSNGQIDLKAESNGDFITISVADSGKGLNPEQVQSFMDEHAGMSKAGLGSVLILHMLKKLNGTLSIQTSSTAGSIFYVTLHQHFQPCNDVPDC